MPSETVVIRFTETGARVVQRNIEGIGLAATTANASMKFLQRSLATLGGIVAYRTINNTMLAVRNAVGVLAEFGQVLSEVEAVSEATSYQMAALTAEARRLGTTTKFSAIEAAGAMAILARAGFDVGQTLISTAHVLNLAQAGSLDVATAATIATRVLRGFRLEASQMERVADVLTKGANATNTSVQGLGDALKFSAPIAATLGVSLEDTVIALGHLSNAGLDASLAGTGLRQIMLRLQDPTAEAGRALEVADLKMQDIDIATRGLLPVLETLSKRVNDVGVSFTLFGARGAPAFEVLSAAIPEMKAMQKVMATIQGEAKRVADIMNNNLNGALLKLKNTFIDLILEMGKLGADTAITKTVMGLTEAIKLLAKNLDVLAGAVLGFGVSFATLKLGGVIAALLQMTQGSRTLFVIFGNLSKLFALRSAVTMATRLGYAQRAVFALGSSFKGLWAIIAAHPIGLIAVALGLLTAAFFAFGDSVKLNAEKGSASLKDTFSAATTVVGDQLAALGRSFVDFFSGVDKNDAALKKNMSTSWEETIMASAKGLDVVGGLIASIFKVIGVVAKNPLESVKLLIRGMIDLFQTAGDAIVAIFVGIWKTASAVVDRIVGAMGSAVSAGEALWSGNMKQAADFAAQAKKSLGDAFTLKLDDTFMTEAKGAFAARSRLPRISASIELLNGAETKDFMVELGTTLNESMSKTPFQDMAKATFDIAQNEAERLKIQEQINKALADQAAEAKKAAAAFEEMLKYRLALAQVLADLEQEASLLRMTSSEREIQTKWLKIEDDLLSKGIVLVGEQRKEFEKEARARLANIQLLGHTARAVEAVKGPTIDLVAAQEDLNRRVSEGQITAQEGARAYRMLQNEALAAATSTEAGFQRGYNNVLNTIENFAEVSQRIVEGAFSGMEDAMVEFVQSGKFNFSQLVDSILADMTRLVFRQAISGLFGNMLGGGGGGGLLGSALGALGGAFGFGSPAAALAPAAAVSTSALGAGSAALPGASGFMDLGWGARAAGGPVGAHDPYLVGERGPELFVPQTAGNVMPSGSWGSPEVNVNVINVTDPDEVTAALTTTAGEKAILNVIRRNKRALTQELA